jgi:Autoinducer binding domain
MIEEPARLGVAMASSLPDETAFTKALLIIEDDTLDIQVVIGKLRDLLKIDHVAYHLHKPSGDYVRLTYPDSWLKRYLNKDYGKVDLIRRHGFQRVRSFNWNELKFQSAAEESFRADYLSHGIGPQGFSIPLTKHGHRALFSISSSRSEREWMDFLATNRSTLIKIANRLHRRVVVEVFGEEARS